MVRPALRRIRTRCNGVGIGSLGDDERVALIIREVIVLPEHGKLDGVKVATNFSERKPANPDEAGKVLGVSRR
jgi:hypothetical protein